MENLLHYLSVPMVLAAIALATYVVFKSRTSQILKEELDVLHAQNERLDKESKLLIAEGHAKDIEIAELRAKTDLTDIRKSQQEIISLVSNAAKTMEMMAATMERISVRMQG